jgi:hypothetical protein
MRLVSTAHSEVPNGASKSRSSALMSHIVVVDDNSAVRWILADLLRRTGLWGRDRLRRTAGAGRIPSPSTGRYGAASRHTRKGQADTVKHSAQSNEHGAQLPAVRSLVGRRLGARTCFKKPVDLCSLSECGQEIA